jgi:hypothetical protein
MLLPTLAVPPNTPSAPFRRVTAVTPETVAMVRASATDHFLLLKVVFPDVQAGWFLGDGVSVNGMFCAAKGEAIPRRATVIAIIRRIAAPRCRKPDGSLPRRLPQRQCIAIRSTGQELNLSAVGDAAPGATIIALPGRLHYPLKAVFAGAANWTISNL